MRETYAKLLALLIVVAISFVVYVDWPQEIAPPIVQLLRGGLF